MYLGAACLCACVWTQTFDPVRVEESLRASRQLHDVAQKLLISKEEEDLQQVTQATRACFDALCWGDPRSLAHCRWLTKCCRSRAREIHKGHKERKRD